MEKKVVGILMLTMTMSFLVGCNTNGNEPNNNETSMHLSGSQDSIENEENTKKTEETSSNIDKDGKSEYTDHYEGNIISFDIPEGMYAKETIRYGSPNAEVTVFTEKDGSEIVFMNILEDYLALTDLYKDATDAQSVYQMFLDEQEEVYEESDKKLPGTCGTELVDIDGSKMYVVWGIGSSWNNVCHYTGYVDSPQGTVVRIIYGVSEEVPESKVQQVFDSMKFK